MRVQEILVIIVNAVLMLKVKGTFKAGENTTPFVGEKNIRHEENEVKTEVIFSSYLKDRILNALFAAHPYEEVAYDIVALSNSYNNIGSGLMSELPQPVSATEFLTLLKQTFNLPVVRAYGINVQKTC